MELKPCPFCGGELEDFPYSYFIDHKNGCFFGTRRYRLWSVRKFNGRGKKSTYDIRKWNTRAERTCELNGTISWEWHTTSTTFYTHSLSCGHNVTTTEQEPPSYCEECGAKVVDA